MASLQPPVPYVPDVEQPGTDEQKVIDELVEVFSGMQRKVAEEEHHASRAVHAKGHALLNARLEVDAGLADELAQGLFSKPGAFDALVRVSSPPAEQLPDTVSTPRAIALKVLGVTGERLQEAVGAPAQDFLMVNGPAFSAPGPSQFLRSARLLAATTERMPRTKRAISGTLRAAESVLEAVGVESGKLKGLGGEPMRHPLGEIYFTQVPFLYGPYMAKFSLVPVSGALIELLDQPLPAHEDAQREAIATFFAGLDAPAEWELRVQLCRDATRMPIEDASVEWPESRSPWQRVARLVVPPQASWSPHESPQAEDLLAFSPWNALSAHRPLGAVNRARRRVMAASRDFRSGFNGCPIH